MHPKTRKRMIIMLIIVGGLLALLVGFNIFKGKMIADYMASAPEPVQTVTAMQADYSDWQPQLNSIGTVRAARGADLALESSGVVSEISVASGDQVKQGDVLLELRSDELSAAVDAAETSLSLARTTFERAKRQVEAKAISRAAFDDAGAALKTARASLAQSRAELAKKQLKAPFSGRIGIVDISPGAYLNAGTSVFTLQQLDPVFLDFSLPQKVLDQVEPGQIVHVAVDGIEQAFTGTLTAISPKVDPATRSFQVEAKVPNPDHLLAGGMFANIAIDAGASNAYLIVPLTAVTYNPYGSTIYVVTEEAGKDKEGKDTTVQVAKQHFVTTGDRRGDQVVVLEGIEQGDTIVTSGALKLYNGAPVEIDNSVTPSNDPHPTPREG